MRGIGVGAALLVTLLFAGGSHAGRTASGHGLIGLIAGESGESVPSPRFVLVHGDGTHARVRLGWVTDGALSPDARRIAYTPLGRSPAIWVAPTEGRSLGRLIARNAADFDWSPRGDAIAFVRYRHACCLGVGDVWTVGAQGRSQRLLVRNGASPDWAPDGTRVAFVRRGGIWVVDVATKRARALIRNGVEPRWSPDGRHIAFARSIGYDTFVYVARADGTGEHRVAEGDSAAWSPDGTELAIPMFTWVLGVGVDGRHRRVVWAPRGGFPALRDLAWER
jgi:Tol biopolymer transport system component